MQSWTKKSLVAVAAGGLLVAGIGSALAGETGQTDSTSAISATAGSVQIDQQVLWAIDSDAGASTAAAAYRSMVEEVRAAAKTLDGEGYLSVDVTLNGATSETVQVIVRASDFAVTGWVDPDADEFVTLDSEAPNLLVGPPRAPAPPRRDDRNDDPDRNPNNDPNNNPNDRDNDPNNGQNANQNPPPPPAQCFDRNGNPANRNNPECAPAPVQRRDAGFRVANTFAAGASASAAAVKLSFEDIIGAFTDLIESGTSAAADLSDAVGTIIQVITGGAGSSTIETAVSDALQS